MLLLAAVLAQPLVPAQAVQVVLVAAVPVVVVALARLAAQAVLSVAATRFQDLALISRLISMPVQTVASSHLQ